ncbi:2Fe-2S iron-sulfur cluster-binding protein [Streptomyces sp. ATexAB-D23]|uniref:2Fe-2S iron-sulfur cluster-binding protein n=1 Tax=unclassified Streptomyces TaxID=2593676 RepID=UPI00036F0224|nr:2Fe-2S iron-sulfur cluster-binding protein [Streptomyces sp. ATexAB-D23]MYY02788.1 (2Fe-2S)-binding protein [Streptomyces sp. SID4913]
MSKENPAEQHGGWEPTPQGGEYDGEATAFVHLPPEDLADIPLAAPGHGYVPPMILPLTPAAGLDPAATGNWAVQPPAPQAGQHEHGTQAQPPAQGAVHWPDPNQQSGYGYPPPGAQQPPSPYQEPYAGDPAATGQWSVDATAWPPPAPEAPETPAASGALSDDSGELYTTPPAADWYADRPATLPGGATAPWATREPAPEPLAPEPLAAEPLVTEAETEAEAEAEQAAENGPDAVAAPVAAADDAPAQNREDAPSDALSDALSNVPSDAPPGVPSELPEARPAAGERPEAAEQTTPASAPADEDVVPDTGPEPVAEASDTPPAAGPPLPSEHPAASYTLHVNGVDRPVTDAWIGESLLYVLRERLGLAGAKDGCSQGECGACNVQVDGRLVASCLVPAATTAGSEVRTVEGLAVDGEPSDVQRALASCGAVQCGFCIPGMAMTVHDLLEGNHAPSELETRRALCGNLCRCSGYRGVLDAVNEVIAGREAAAEAAAPPPESAEQEEARIPHQAAPGAGSVQAHQQDGGMA